MVLGLTKKEFKLAKELTHIALANAAASFAKMTNEQVTFQDIKVNPSKFQFNQSKKLAKEPLYIMLTEYVGDVIADTFLVLTPENAQLLAEKLFPSPKLNDTLKEAILLETDNILAAAVATKYSDILGHEVTGDVPQLIRKTLSETQQYIDDRLEHDHTHFSYITSFISEKSQIEAHFICAFRDSFGAAIKTVSSQQERVAIIDAEEVQSKQYLR